MFDWYSTFYVDIFEGKKKGSHLSCLKLLKLLEQKTVNKK
jgi:hypothetical protein